MAKLLGKNFQLMLEKDNEMVPVCCGRELTITINSDLLEATKPPSSVWRSYYYGNKNWTVESSGLIETGEGFGFADLYDAIANSKTIIFVAKHDDTVDVFFSGKILISSMATTGNNKDMMQQSFSATGDGELNIINPYGLQFLTDENGAAITDENGNVIYIQTSGDLPPVNLNVKC